MNPSKRCPHEEDSRAARMWRRGWEACQNDKDPEHCPTSRDPDRNHWINGYTAAQLRAQLGEEPEGLGREQSDQSIG